MSINPLTMARRQVLADLNNRCEPVQNVPVYLEDTTGAMLGLADETFGKYADAITFHLAEDVCKKLAVGQFTYSFEYNYIDENHTATTSARRRIKLSTITLISRKGYEKPLPRGASKTLGEAADVKP